MWCHLKDRECPVLAISRSSDHAYLTSAFGRKADIKIAKTIFPKLMSAMGGKADMIFARHFSLFMTHKRHSGAWTRIRNESKLHLTVRAKASAETNPCNC